MLIPYYQRKRLQQEKSFLTMQTSLIAQAHNNNLHYASPQVKLQYQQMMQQLA
jgi:hypothetical protein